jgi:hypothetical protein
MLKSQHFKPLFFLDLANSSFSGHQDFSESTEEIAPLTEQERAEKLEALKEKLKEKRAKQALADKEDAKRNEVINSLFLPSCKHHV